jgi:hypothetical protein
MRLVAAAFAELMVVAGLAGPACAASPAEEQALEMQIFGHAVGESKAHACFRRVYEAEHLKRHPKQNVRSMTLLVTGHASTPNEPEYSLAIDVRFRKSGTHFETYGSCGGISSESEGGTANVVNCGVDCDGGEIDVKLKDDNAVLVAIPEGARVWDPKSGDDEPPEGRGHFGDDDKIFMLDRTALTDCLSLAGDDDDKAAIGRGE